MSLYALQSSWSVREYDNTETWERSLPGRSHRANVVHQLLVLHETPATEVTSPGVPLDGCLLRENDFQRR